MLFLEQENRGNAPLHNAHMILDERVFGQGAAIYANVAVSWLLKHQTEGEKKNEVKKQKQKKDFTCLMCLSSCC